MGCKDTHLVEQIDGTQRRSDISTDDDHGQTARHTSEYVAAEGFFARGNKHNKGTVGLWMLVALDEVGEGHKTPVALIAEVGDDAGSKSSFGHVALHLVSYRFAVRSVKDSKLRNLTE